MKGNPRKNFKALKGIYLFYELVGPEIPLEYIIYLGEGQTPIVQANKKLRDEIGINFYFKNEGLNPSASFKDRGMASALSYINYLIEKKGLKNVISICASTGDTSASAALYSSYLSSKIKSVVILPYKKVTPQQLSQPLGSGAIVFEIPGVFDDCMKIVEALSEKYNVALLNSKNAWRILGQESYSYEIAQQFDYDLSDKVIIVPVGNAGNITAIIQGFLKLYYLSIIEDLPKIIGVQTHHANPVYKYYSQPKEKRKYEPVAVKPSVAQAAMIGDPVSMPRVIDLVERYNSISKEEKIFFVEVTEQQIIDWQLIANRNGNIACTQGGESLAALIKAKELGLISPYETAVVTSTAHFLKFSNFQNMYFEDNFPKEYEIRPKEELKNKPISLIDLKKDSFSSYKEFINYFVEKIAEILKL